MQKTFLKNRGFTLIEIMIGLMISCVLVLGLTRLYSTMLNSYSLQEQLTEMNQNAKFTIKEISDVLMQAGADCELVNDSLEKDNIISVASAPCSSFTIKVNPRGGLFIVTQLFIKTATSCSLQVDNGYAFSHADSLGQIPESNTAPKRSVKTYELKGVNLANNKILISGGTTKDSFYLGDGLYSFNSQRYYLKGTNVCLDSDANVLAENIDTLKVTFMDSVGNTQTSWKLMSSVALFVDATTALPDARYTRYSDHRRHLPLTYTFRLKNKV